MVYKENLLERAMELYYTLKEDELEEVSRRLLGKYVKKAEGKWMDKAYQRAGEEGRDSGYSAGLVYNKIEKREDKINAAKKKRHMMAKNRKVKSHQVKYDDDKDYDKNYDK